MFIFAGFVYRRNVQGTTMKFPKNDSHESTTGQLDSVHIKDVYIWDVNLNSCQQNIVTRNVAVGFLSIDDWRLVLACINLFVYQI